MRVLITGGTGYVGSHVALDLAARGLHVTAVARAPRPGTSSIPERLAQLESAGVVMAHADLSVPGDLVAALPDPSFDVIVHGVCSFLEPIERESLTLRAMTELLALGARTRGLAQVIDLSNNLVLAPPAPAELPTEEAECRPDTAHGRNKLEAERMLRRSGLPWVCLRIGQIYGGSGSSFDWVMVEPIRKRELPVPCNGRNRAALVHVEDVAQSVWRSIERGVRDRVFNVASGDHLLTLGSVFDEIARGFGLRPPPRLPRPVALGYAWLSERWARARGREPRLIPDMIRVLAANRSLSIERARRELGFEPRHPDVLKSIRESYADVFAGHRAAFAPAGRLASVRGR